MSAFSSARRPVDATGAALMTLLCLLWGFTYVFSKLAAADISLVLQGGLRSVIAALLLLVWARARGIPLFSRDGTLGAGLAAGVLFAAEFLFIFAGLAHTGASRMVVFIYLAPCFTALGLQWLVPGERLHARQWAGIALAFVGVAAAFADGFASERASLLGDAFGVIAAALWAATTVIIRSTRLNNANAAKTLFYQLAVAGVALPPASLLLGEPGVVALTPIALVSLLYQGAVISFASYLIWFWLLTRYLAARLSVFTFLSPLFGVTASVAVLSEPLRPAFVAAVALVGAGIYLVNRPAPAHALRSPPPRRP
ncbi:MAG TPA: DMT family transporter [Burkholderiales bacterium]|nr:DMT family transporter [Burkholderiales bacterium]